MSSECKAFYQHDHRETIDIAVSKPDARSATICRAWG